MEVVTVIDYVTETIAVEAGVVTIVTPPTIQVVEVSGELLLLESEPVVSVVTLDPDVVVLDPSPVITVIEIGIAGPQGPPGPPGPPGSGSGGAAGYTHTQGVPASVWTINHALGFVPAVTVFNTLGDVVIGGIAHPTVNQAVLTFSAAFSGTAYLS